MSGAGGGGGGGDGTGDGDAAELARLRARVVALEHQIGDMFTRNAPVKLFIDPETGAIVDANPAAATFYGYSQAELRGLPITSLNQLPAELVQREMQRARDERRSYFEFKHRLKCGTLRDVQVYSGPCEVDGRPLLFSIVIDITERNRLAVELAQAQRMDALGRLAGGVAHDFNNLLTTVQMLATLIGRNAARGRDVGAEVEEMGDLVTRGSSLTRQLLAFCRRQVMRTLLVDVAVVLAGMQQLLQRLVGESIELHIDVGTAPALVVGDPSQLEQVILNLVVNGRDAMPAGGRLSISVELVELEAARAAELGLEAGPHVLLDVTDSGVGIRPELQPHVFEPFFTTKQEGQGTGLGLATVYGIVRQSGGMVTLDSAPERGSRFSVWLPRASAERQPLMTEPARAEAVGGSETILLVDDDLTIRRSIQRLLADRGYRVIEARDGADAIAVAAMHRGPIQLLLTDVVMPRMGGRELAEHLLKARPDTRVLYMSGYVDTPAVDHGLLDAAESLLMKPFSADELLQKIREVLDGSVRRAVVR